jgi:NADH-quinone oxidoreductase subunit A
VRVDVIGLSSCYSDGRGGYAAGAIYPENNQPYECGVDPVGDASVGQVKIHYFVIAIVFIIFDVETLYLFPWAVVLTDIGLFGYIEMFVFIFLLLVGFIYAWATGALEWQI